MSIKICYVYHSCFIVELDSCYIMFDYYKHYNSKEANDFNFDNLIRTILDSKKPFYIFVSHGHSDHINKKIFDYNSQKTSYILSDDVKTETNSSNINYISPGNMLKLDDISINAFSSTDLGVSFMIDVNNTVIFYAGDLNWWAWPDDTKEEAEYMENFYKTTVEEIKKINKEINIAFFPVDKRLEENYDMGGNYFIEHLHPKVFIPMHFGNDYEATKMFRDKYYNVYTNTKIVEITNTNQYCK